MLLKAAPRPFETTFRVVNYGNGALAVLYLVPVVGWIALLPWYFIVMIIGTSKAQEVSTGQAGRVPGLAAPALVGAARL